jgi:hypothetical protein
MARITIKSLVEVSLGYCCLWFFFTRFRRNRVVADRLGVTRQGVSQARASCGGCAGKPTCMDRHITLKLKARRRAAE